MWDNNDYDVAERIKGHVENLLDSSFNTIEDLWFFSILIIGFIVILFTFVNTSYHWGYRSGYDAGESAGLRTGERVGTQNEILRQELNRTREKVTSTAFKQ